MIIHEGEQYTQAWEDARIGIPSASQAKRFITASGSKSAQSGKYMGELIAIKHGLQEPEDIPQTEWVSRGTNTEMEARQWFKVVTGLTIQEIMFITNDDGTAGLSPDGGIFEDNKLVAGLELKVPKPSTHLAWLEEDKLPADHRQQVHMSIGICKVPWYFMSYCPGVKPLIVKVEKDEYTGKVSKCLEDFIKRIANAEDKYIIDDGEDDE